MSVGLDHSRPLVDKLLQGQLDILVARLLDADRPESLQFEPLEDERHAVLVGGQHPLAGKADVRLEDLLDYPWILPPPESVLRERLTGVFLQRGLAVPANIVQTQSMPVITHLLRVTDAVAETSRSQCNLCANPAACLCSSRISAWKSAVSGLLRAGVTSYPPVHTRC